MPKSQLSSKEFVNYTLPTYLASYLINNDASNLNDGELVEIETFIARERKVNKFEMFHAVGCHSEEFAYTNDMNNLGNTVATFTIQVA